MRQQQPTTSKKKGTKTNIPVHSGLTCKPPLADSLEVMELYYIDRIGTINNLMQQLNLMEDAPEIEFLCREIMEARAALQQIAAKK